MTDPWADVREIANNPSLVMNHNPAPALKRILADADAMLAVVRAGRKLDLLRMADYIEDMQDGDEDCEWPRDLRKDEDWEWPRDLRKFATALTALLEHLK